jgi:hypothetical protein
MHYSEFNFGFFFCHSRQRDNHTALAQFKILILSSLPLKTALFKNNRQYHKTASLSFLREKKSALHLGMVAPFAAFEDTQRNAYPPIDKALQLLLRHSVLLLAGTGNGRSDETSEAINIRSLGETIPTTKG